MKYYIEIHVKGKGDFPLDMLRFGCLFPVDSQSANEIVPIDINNDREERRRLREIKLACYADSSIAADHICDRFASFLWAANVWNVTRV